VVVAKDGVLATLALRKQQLRRAMMMMMMMLMDPSTPGVVVKLGMRRAVAKAQQDYSYELY